MRERIIKPIRLISIFVSLYQSTYLIYQTDDIHIDQQRVMTMAQCPQRSHYKTSFQRYAEKN